MRFGQNAGFFGVFAAVFLHTLGATHGAESPALGVGTIVGDHVNVRGKATLASEVVTRLQRGEKVTILEELTPAKLKADEASRWFRIALPLNTPVWVHAGFLDETGRTALQRLNLRSGAGENFSVLGRIEKGTAVQELRRKEEWMEIVAPAGAYAFVSADLVEFVGGMMAKGSRSTPAPPEKEGVSTTVETTKPAAPAVVNAAAEPAVVVIPVEKPAEPNTEVVVVVETPPAVQSLPSDPVLAGVSPSRAAAVVSEAPPAVAVPLRSETFRPVPGAVVIEGKLTRRIVTREGLVSGTFFDSIQAPTFFGLRTAQGGRLINFLHAGKLGIKLESYKGRKVLVTGEEFIDRRWASTPVLEVESLDLVP